MTDQPLEGQPFFAIPWLDFDRAALLTVAKSIPEQLWRGQGPPEYVSETPLNLRPADSWGMNTALSYDHDYSTEPAIQHLNSQLTLAGGCRAWYYSIAWKRSRKGYRSPMMPMMAYAVLDQQLGIDRTFDILIALEGDFETNPLTAVHVPTGKEYTLTPRGHALAIPTTRAWHYSWYEGEYPYRYTLHLRSRAPITWQLMHSLSSGKT